MALGLFLGLTIIIAVIPALKNQANNAPLPNSEPLSKAAEEGKKIFIANGCVACHTQQVRNVDMDKTWGNRPGIAADYAANTRIDFWRNTATLMGTERTGPDLTNIGIRQPGKEWNLLHLYQPRAVVNKSIMPAYPWLFDVKKELVTGDVELIVPDEFRKGVTGKIVATTDALNLLAYLQSLKQTPLPQGMQESEFLYKKKSEVPSASGADKLPDGKMVYANNCQSCHQENGEGLKGAFPPLKGSKIVHGNDLELYVTIIMKGYDAREEYASMGAIGTINHFTPEDVAALINFERSSWGNNGKKVSAAEVKKIMETLK